MRLTRRAHIPIRSCIFAWSCCVLALGSGRSVADAGARWLVAFEAPSAHVLHELAVADAFDVRWVEKDLILAEVESPEALPSLWGGRLVARREAGIELALLHGRNLAALRADAGMSKALRTLGAARAATLHAHDDDVWVLLGPSEAWPPGLLGCHGKLVLPRHHVDPRSLIDAGPPPALRPWVLAPQRNWTPGERAVLEAVNEDSLRAFFDLLTLNAIGFPADRYVFSPELQGVYIPRVQNAMQDAIAGNLGATVELQPFEKERRCPAGIESVSTANVIARLPGSIPGTGTFVVCAHVDATGSNDAGWIEEARNQCVPPSQTPGGEDNASGVAAVLEALRCIAEGMRAGQIDFAFDLEFIAFSGEEAEGNDSQPDGLNRFLTGSQLYVRERVKEVDSQGPILGALNLDMIGSEQLGNNLQLVHNPASEWMAQLVVEAAGFVDPPLDLTLVPQLDEALASDHNSFWTVNAAGILAADAPVDTLRSYATYHRPIDTGFDRDVRAAKMREVTRAVVATLLRFDTNVHSDPALFVPVESFRTFTKPPDGQETNYDHRFRRLFPEDPVESRLHLYNLGAEYVGPVRLSVRKHREDGTTIVLTEDTRQRTIPTGGQVLFVEPIPIFESDAGVNRITAEVAWSGPGGVEVRTNVVDTLVVRGHQPEFAAFSPNPVRDLQEATLLLQLRTPGTVTIRLYNLEGEEVYVGTQSLARADRRGILPGECGSVTCVSLASSSARNLDLVSGPYFARVEFRGDDGSNASSSARLVVLR